MGTNVDGGQCDSMTSSFVPTEEGPYTLIKYCRNELEYGAIQVPTLPKEIGIILAIIGYLLLIYL